MTAQAERAYEAWRGAVVAVHPELADAPWATLSERMKDAWREAIVAAMDAPEPATETLTETQVRLLEESETVRAGKLLKRILPSDRGFVLFTFQFGPGGGNLAYISTASRHDAIRLLREWLRKERALR
jgi:hypothetical protein